MPVERTAPSARRTWRVLLPAVAGTVVGTVMATGAADDADAARLQPAAPQSPSQRAPATDPPATVTVVAGDTVSAIAAAHGRRTADVLAANGIDARGLIFPGQVLQLGPEASAPAAPVPHTGATTHTVRPGDTVTAIAARHATTVDAVLAANGLTRASIIYPDQVLVVSAAPDVEAAAVAETAPSVALDAEQRENAALVVRIGRELGVPERGIAIALGTAMQESWLRNLDGGDRDSGGLFQQRPSTGWGTEAEVRDPERATRAFFGGPGAPNGPSTRGLLDVPGWEGLPYADAAQAVQISAYPERYARWEVPAASWVAALG